jgi:5'-nucleotidase
MAIAMLVAMSVPTVVAKGPKPRPPIDIQILGLNDFHGQLEVVDPVSSSGGRIGFLTDTDPGPGTRNQCLEGCIPAGGVEYLATHVAQLRATNPKNTVFVSAGDLIGATPLLSALFHDEPSIEAFNLMGLDYNGVGNHEFDEGIDELLRVAYGSQTVEGYTPARPDGCHPLDECGDLDPYHGADFKFLAANVAYKDTGETIFPPYAVHNFGGEKVAFVGMTLEGTPLIVSPGGIASVNFLDEADSVNALVPHLKRRGVEAIVVLLHEGGVAGPGNGGPNTGNADLINTCDNPRGPVADVVQRMDAEIDIVITGHTNWAVNCPNMFGKVVTGAGSQGRLITDIDVQLDPNTNDFVPNSYRINNRIVTQDVAEAPALTDLIAKYKVFEGPIAAEVVGEVVGLMDRNVRTAAGESTLGRLIADAQLASTQGDAAPGVIAFMNPGGIRNNLEGVVTHGEAFAVQPFSNIVTTKTMTGAQIKTVLEQQFALNSLSDPGAVGATARAVNNRVILQVSRGFTYTWSESAPLGSKVSNMRLNGTPIGMTTEYRVTMNNFIGAGGDDLPAFTLGTNEVTGLDDLVALEAYLALPANRPYTPDTVERITTVP